MISNKEYTVTGHLKETKGVDKQTYLLHKSFVVESKDKAIENFYEYFKPELEVIKIFSVMDHNGNQI